MTKFNFDSLNDAVHVYPEQRIIIKEAKKQQVDGISEGKILSESLQFANSMAYSYYARLVNKANSEISNGIGFLSESENWVSLGKVAEHALEQKVRILKNSTFKDVLEHTEKQLKVLRSNIPELSGMLKYNKYKAREK